MASVGRIIRELIPESEGSSDEDVMEREKALEGNGGTTGLVKPVHEGIYAGTWKKV